MAEETPIHKMENQDLINLAYSCDHDPTEEDCQGCKAWIEMEERLQDGSLNMEYYNIPNPPDEVSDPTAPAPEPEVLPDTPIDLVLTDKDLEVDVRGEFLNMIDLLRTRAVQYFSSVGPSDGPLTNTEILLLVTGVERYLDQAEALKQSGLFKPDESEERSLVGLRGIVDKVHAWR